MAAALPDRYGTNDNGKEPKVVTNNFLVSIGIITGACGVAVMGSSLIVKTTEFYNFANYFLAVMRQTQFVVYVGFGALILGFLGIVTGLIVSVTGLYVSQYPKLLHCSLFCLVASACGNIAAGAVIGNGVGLLNNAIYSQSSTPAPENSFTQNVTHFQIAMFNGCCAGKGRDYTKEVFNGDPNRVETQDLDGYVKYCDNLNRDNLDDITKSSLKIRSCFNYQDTYRIYNFTVGNNLPRICKTLEDALVNIAGKKVPGTNTDVTGITGNKPIIPIVGPLTAPTYGCGVGYAKAFQAAMLIWAENNISPIGTAFIACGAVYLFLAIIAFATHFSCSQPRETAEEKYARYLEEVNNSSQGVVKTAQIVDNFEQSNPNRMSMPSNAPGGSNRMSVQNNRLSMQSYASQPQPQQAATQEFAFNVDDKI